MVDPTSSLDPSEARDYLISLPERIGKPKAIVIVSAHFETDGPVVVSDANPEMIYDFGGFAPELYEMVYPAPGDPDLAMRVATMLDDAGLTPRLAPRRGYDHGTWTSMKLAYPEADIPIVQLSIDPGRNAAYHFALGQALAPLAEENILLIGSGHISRIICGQCSARCVAELRRIRKWLARLLPSPIGLQGNSRTMTVMPFSTGGKKHRLLVTTIRPTSI
ncbi:MAG: class III extradiol ring-cleavage dioxygenase [Nitratireductor sp.]